VPATGDPGRSIHLALLADGCGVVSFRSRNTPIETDMDITATTQGLPLVAPGMVLLPPVLGIGAWSLRLFFPNHLLTR